MAKKSKQRPVSGTERMISAGILCLLGLIAVAIYQKSLRFDESLFNVTLATEAGAAESGAEESDSLLTKSIALAGYAQEGAIDFYIADDIWIKIDGKDGAYYAYDVVSLEFRCFKRGEPGAADAEAGGDEQEVVEEDEYGDMEMGGMHSHGAGEYIDIYLYDMGSPLTAYGIYSVERSMWGEQLDLGREAYTDGDSVFFCQGNYYGQVLASEPDIGLKDGVLAVARDLADKLEDDGQPLPNIDLVQLDGLKENSIKYYHVDALGQSFLKEVFMADVEYNGAEFTFYIHQAESAEVASQIAGQYIDFIKSMGELKREFPLAGAECWHGAMFGQNEIFFTKGDLFGGVNATDKPEEAEALLLAYLNQVDEQ